MQSLQQTMHHLYSSLRAHPSVLFICPVSSSLGRRLALNRKYDSQPPRLADMTVVKHGSALVVCNSRNRGDYHGELDDARLFLTKHLRLKVHYSLFTLFTVYCTPVKSYS